MSAIETEQGEFAVITRPEPGQELSALRQCLAVPPDIADECMYSRLLATIRASVAVFLLSYALHGLFLDLAEWSRGYAFLLELKPGRPALAVFGCLAVSGICVLFGVRTRLVVALSLGSLNAMALWSAASATFEWERWMMVFAVNLMAYPLIRFGAGRWALLRGGWRLGPAGGASEEPA